MPRGAVDTLKTKPIGTGPFKFVSYTPGDRLVIPPGMPHIFTATPGHTFTYLIFKQRV